MPLVVFHTRKVRDVLKAPATLGIDLLLLGAVGAVVGALVMFAKQVSAPYSPQLPINLSVWALPKYTLFSLSRGFAAYFLSLVFTLAYGSIAAHNRRAEKVMVPALDVLQSLPVLTFLPGLVLAMIAIFPSREVGLEIACVITIFTAQAWNMTFSFYGSIRNIPAPLREVASIHHLGRWKVFRLLEVPSSMIGLVWNSMMSMAGGWFFLSVCEAFTLRDKNDQLQNFRLPGIGSYMSEASAANDVPHQIAAVVAMILMIVMVDQLFWRPIVVWADRFKMEETADADKPESWVLNVLAHSRIYQALMRRMRHHDPADAPVAAGLPASNQSPAGDEAAAARPAPRPAARSNAAPLLAPIAKWVILSALAVAGVWGMVSLVRLLVALPIHDPARQGADWMHVLLALLASFGRTSAAVLLGAAWALPAGILIGLSPKWSQRLQPVVQVVASFPAPMLFAVVIIGLAAIRVPFTIGCITLMLLGTQWYILFNVIAGAMAIPSELKEVCRVYRTSRWKRWSRLYVPCVLPYLVTGMVTAAGGAWNATIVAEYVETGGKTYTAFGLGSIISQASNSNFPLLAAAAVTMAISVVILNRLIWKRAYRVAEERYALNT